MEVQYNSIWEVEFQTPVKREEICDDEKIYGYDAICELGLKQPGRWSLHNLVATLSGKLALRIFKKGQLVAVKLGFTRIKINHQWSNRLTVEEISLVQKLENKECYE